MKLLAASVFAIGLSLAAMTASKAMPVAPLDQSASADIIQVFGGCGYGGRPPPHARGPPPSHSPPPSPTRPPCRPCACVSYILLPNAAPRPPPPPLLPPHHPP